MTFESMEKETDCAIYPRMIRKPTTTMAPTTAEMEAETGLRAGDIAAIILAVILIILIILIILFAVYLWKTKKMRHVAPISFYTSWVFLLHDFLCEDKRKQGDNLQRL